MALGMHEGDIYLYHTPSLLDPDQQQPSPKPKVLHGHFHRVYALHTLPGRITREGSTSLFPTFVGRAREEVEREFLVSIGFGRGYSFLKKKRRTMFKKSCVGRGSFVNAWML